MHRHALLLALLVATGCNDPTKGKVAATVGSVVAVSDAAVPATTASGAATVTYAISPATSKVGFVGSKATGKHEGSFGKFAGTIEVPGGKLEAAKVTLSIETSSLKTDDEELDEHLRSKDFFDVAKFPKATFTSTSIVAGGAAGATHTLTGNLELHGVTKSIGVPATIKREGSGISATSEFTIKRKDFAIVYPGKPDDLIKDDVLIKLTIVGAPPG
jgi:polyisoprenoid-binding protein YceI